MTCPRCRTENPPGANFCLKCAAPLGARAALEGERKQVTVLFADLKGSMELLADRDPEEARAILDPVLEHMMEAVHRYEGTVNQVMGDRIMALFGAPIAHGDHAVRVCYAAR
jgi:class 3 adenylate cyclase